MRSQPQRFSAICLLVLVSPVVTNALAAEPKPRAEAVNRWKALQRIERNVTRPGDHPGNVYWVDQVVHVTVPDDAGPSIAGWRARNDLGLEVAAGQCSADPGAHIEVGKLGVGWYCLEFLDAKGAVQGWTTAAVLKPLAVPTPQNSPICVDSATAWFAKDDPVKQQQFSRLAALAGVNWIRDRMRWREIQPAEGEFRQDTTYDTAAEIQRRFGLKVLQVFHDTPAWAATQDARGRIPGDLRAVYRFGKEMGRRFQGSVQAWEPWNEGNVSDFGGHAIDELCSYQKAAYLGFKAGDPDLTVCWNATTGTPTDRHTKGVLANQAATYFDTYNIHTYDWSHDYQRLWRPARQAAGGKPIWITESDRGIKAVSQSEKHDRLLHNDILKAQYIPQSYASSLFAGANRHFHFILGHYGEQETQFGLLRHDLTPRPAYVALAAVGRLLAGARCLGRVDVNSDPQVHVYAYRAQPDGRLGDVLVAWTETKADWPRRGVASAPWSLPTDLTIDACYDYLGRQLEPEVPDKLTSSPIYLLLPCGSTRHLNLQTSDLPPAATPSDTAPSWIVLQRLMPQASCQRIEEIPWAWEFEHQVEPDEPAKVPLFVYNFSDQEVSGNVVIQHLPVGIQATPKQWQVDLSAMDRIQLPATFEVDATEATYSTDRWIVLRGDFGPAGRPVLAFQLDVCERKSSSNSDP